MKKVVLGVSLLALALGSTTACATKKFVRGEVGQVNNKVDTLSKSLEETQERTKANEAKIGEVDQKVAVVDQKAAAADQKAVAASKNAEAAGAAAAAVNTRADAIEKASKRIVYEVVLNEEKGNFKFGRSTMPETVTPEIDQLVQQLKANPNGAFIEIEGHTDNVGDKEINYKLGLERAENVKRYLYETHQVPLHKINVISYGEDKPVGDNKTKDGRAQNRRVVIKVLA
jgi:outer membrane protein OmpA-like peptidoglycan-associated protein